MPNITTATWTLVTLALGRILGCSSLKRRFPSVLRRRRLGPRTLAAAWWLQPGVNSELGSTLAGNISLWVLFFLLFIIVLGRVFAGLRWGRWIWFIWGLGLVGFCEGSFGGGGGVWQRAGVGEFRIYSRTWWFSGTVIFRTFEHGGL